MRHEAIAKAQSADVAQCAIEIVGEGEAQEMFFVFDGVRFRQLGQG
jgi:hypothetical protein